jgi:hypothetical protein
VDRLFVDEAQAFKNLFYVSKMTRVAGLPQTASERAFDMFLKVQHVQRMNGGGGVVFATGTPVTNTMAEMFTMQRYLQMDVLRRRTCSTSTRGRHVRRNGDGDGAGPGRRGLPAAHPLRAIRERAGADADVPVRWPTCRRRTCSSSRCRLEGGKPRIVRAPATPELKAFVASLAERAEKLKREKVDPSDDNMLKITGEGRKAALDLRLVMRPAPDASRGQGQLKPSVKSSRIWQETRSPPADADGVLRPLDAEGGRPGASRSTRTSRRSWSRSACRRTKSQFIQDHDSDAAKLALFKDVRSGKVRILMGSSQKMGAGTNVQAKLVALHHLDAPWRPADIEQREGRILRQGNKTPRPGKPLRHRRQLRCLHVANTRNQGEVHLAGDDRADDGPADRRLGFTGPHVCRGQSHRVR